MKRIKDLSAETQEWVEANKQHMQQFTPNQRKWIANAYDNGLLADITEASKLVSTLAQLHPSSNKFALLVYGDEFVRARSKRKSDYAKEQAAREIAAGTRQNRISVENLGEERYNNWKAAISRNKWADAARAKRKYKNSKQYYIDTYGDEWQTHYNENRYKRYGNTNIARLGEEKHSIMRAKMSFARTSKYSAEYYKQWHARISQSKTIAGFIARYGEEQGIELYNRYIGKLKHSHSYQTYIDKYGEEAKSIWQAHKYGLGNPKSISTAETGLFDRFDTELGLTGNRQYSINQYKIDYAIPEYSIAVEYNGSPWHANPLKYSPADKPNPYSYKCSSDIWAQDKEKADAIVTAGFNHLFYIWDTDNEATLSRIVTHLMEIIHGSKQNQMRP